MISSLLFVQSAVRLGMRPILERIIRRFVLHVWERRDLYQSLMWLRKFSWTIKLRSNVLIRSALKDLSTKTCGNMNLSALFQNFDALTSVHILLLKSSALKILTHTHMRISKLISKFAILKKLFANNAFGLVKDKNFEIISAESEERFADSVKKATYSLTSIITLTV